MHGGGAIAKANPEGRTRVDFGGHVRTPGGGVPLGLWFWLPSMRPWGRLETFVLCYAGPIGLAGGSPCAFAHVQRHGRDGCQSRWARAAVCFFRIEGHWTAATMRVRVVCGAIWHHAQASTSDHRATGHCLGGRVWRRLSGKAAQRLFRWWTLRRCRTKGEAF